MAALVALHNAPPYKLNSFLLERTNILPHHEAKVNRKVNYYVVGDSNPGTYRFLRLGPNR